MVTIAWLGWLAWSATPSHVPTLAVVDLNNFTGDALYDEVGTSVAARLRDRFGGLSAVRIVERSRLEAALAERSLDWSDVVRRSAALELGGLVEADFVVFGALVGAQGGTLTTSLRVVETDSARLVVASHLASPLDDDGPLGLVGAIVDRLLDEIDLPLSPDERRQARVVRPEDRRLVPGGRASDDGAGEVPTEGLDTERLVARLARPAADPGSCSPDGDVPMRIMSVDLSVANAVVESHRAGGIADRVAIGCLARLDDYLSAEEAEGAWTALLEGVSEGLYAEGPTRESALKALARRPAGVTFEDRARHRFVKSLAKLAGEPTVDEVIATFDIEDGVWLGRPLTGPRLAELDEPTLSMVARLHPDPGIRREAGSTIVARELGRSRFAIVRDRIDAALISVVERGFWPVPADTAILGVSFVEGAAVGRLHLVAEPARRGGRLVVEHPDGALTGSAFALDGLRVQFEGLETPVGVCSAHQTEPCVDPARISLSHPRASTDGRQVVIEPWLDIDEIVAFARSGTTMVLPLGVHESRVSLEFDVVFAPVEPLELEGAAGEPGPDLLADVHAIYGHRWLVAVKPARGGRTREMVVEADDDSFFVMSRGGPPRQVDGQGGRGGNLTVRLHCDEDCATMDLWARARFRSSGGLGRGRGEPGRVRFRVVE